MSHRLGTVAALLAVALVTVSGCSSSGSKSAGSSSPSTSSSSPSSSASSSDPSSTTSSSVSPSPASPSDVAARQATVFVPTYLAELDKLYNDPTININDIYQVAVAPESTVEAQALGIFRGASDRGGGASRLVMTSNVTAHLSGVGGTSSTANYPAVELTACVDVTGVTAIDATGKSLVPAGRPKYLVERLTIVNIKYPDTASWRVSDAPNSQAATCAG
jgi:hypothetical protein